MDSSSLPATFLCSAPPSHSLTLMFALISSTLSSTSFLCCSLCCPLSSAHWMRSSMLDSRDSEADSLTREEGEGRGCGWGWGGVCAPLLYVLWVCGGGVVFGGGEERTGKEGERWIQWRDKLFDTGGADAMGRGAHSLLAHSLLAHSLQFQYSSPSTSATFSYHAPRV